MSVFFGKFKIIKQIGGGRLSQVFRVTREEGVGPEPKVALKRVQPSLIAEPAFVQLVVREAGLLAKLSHENLCQCQEMGVVDGCAFLTLDLVEGCTLRALMRRLSQLEVKLPPSAILALANQLATALDYLHHCETPLVHLDLSPQNVMITLDGSIKLIDFGLARFLDGQNPPPLDGKIAGTVGYMSPEQARGQKPSAHADQYGLGILLWEMLTGRRLFRGHTAHTWQRMRRGKVPLDNRTLADTPEDLAQVVRRMLKADPEQRFDSMQQLLRKLRACSSDPQSGMRPLAALVKRLMSDPQFDPFDVVTSSAAEPEAQDIPAGGETGEEYDELTIQVDQGEGSPASQVRAALMGEVDLPSSPFLETIDDPNGSYDESISEDEDTATG